MTDKTRIKIAATVTALFLAAISVVGLAARKDKPTGAPDPAPAAAAVQTPSAVPAGPSSADDDDGYNDERQPEREHDD